MLGRQHLAVAAVVPAPHDRRIEIAAIEGGEQVARVVKPDLDGQRRIMRTEPRQQGGYLGTADMGGDAEPEVAANSRETGDRAVVRGKQLARRLQEHRAARRKPHQPRRPLDQSFADPVFQPLQLDADRALCAAEGFGGAREAAQIGDSDEGSYRIYVQRHVSYLVLLSLK